MPKNTEPNRSLAVSRFFSSTSARVIRMLPTRSLGILSAGFLSQFLFDLAQACDEGPRGGWQKMAYRVSIPFANEIANIAN